ncbi:MAG: hypothetical protein NVSMB47_07510 [Polyangiales bacterium]
MFARRSLLIAAGGPLTAALVLGVACGTRTGLAVDAGGDSEPPGSEGILPDTAPVVDGRDGADAPPIHGFIAAGYGSACVVLDGLLRCWGLNNVGQLGDRTTMGPRTRPFLVPRLAPVAEVVLGGATCARMVDGKVLCWGKNVYGEVGMGSVSVWPDAAPVLEPTPAVGIETAVALPQGANAHVCAQLADGTAACWGNDTDGNFDEPSAVLTNQPAPIAIPPLAGAKGLSIASDRTCAVFGDGSVQCTGNNIDGELGDGTRTGRGEFAPVVGLSNAVAVACGVSHTCAIVADRTVRCWGSNFVGQVGIALGVHVTMPQLTPVAVPALGNVKALSLGLGQSCALLFDGTVQCWGSNRAGELGDGTTTDRYTPQPVRGLSKVAQIAAGDEFVCALTVDRRVFCWGSNKYGQLGDGTTTDRALPGEVTW